MKPDVVKKPSPWQHLYLLLIQSIVAILAVGIVLLLRYIGGDSYAELTTYFRAAMLENAVFAEQPIVTAAAQSDAVVTQTTTSIKETAVVVPPLKGGVVTSRYGERQDPFDQSVTAGHDGVDIAAPFETPLAALADGVVSEVGYEENGYGHYVLVTCKDEGAYLYAHCSKVNVTTGENVSAGQTIALVGSTGRSTGNHVHIEYRRNGECLDPMLILPEATYA